MKKNFFSFLLTGIISCVSMICYADVNQNVLSPEQPFEGEIVYETFEHWSDAIKKQANFSYFNGVHKIRLILKGEKMHMIDETTKIHYVADGAAPSYTEYCEWTQKGYIQDHRNVEIQEVLAPRDIYCFGETYRLVSNTFSEKSEEKTVLDYPCKLYEGDICRKILNKQNYSIKAYVSNLVAPAGYKWSLLGLNIPGIALKCRMKLNLGHVNGLGIVKSGEFSCYKEADVVEIIPRTVSDEELVVPSNYKIVSGMNGFATIRYQKEVKKALKEHGIIGENGDVVGDNSNKTTGVHYQTDEEWDF